MEYSINTTDIHQKYGINERLLRMCMCLSQDMDFPLQRKWWTNFKGASKKMKTMGWGRGNKQRRAAMLHYGADI